LLLTLRDRRRFDRLVGPHLDGLYRFARSLVRDAAGADDLVQEALVNAMARIGSLRDDSAFAVWSHRVLYTTHLDRQVSDRRHQRRLDAVVHALRPTPPTPADRFEQQELGAGLAAAIDALPDEQREAVWLVDVEGMAFAEVAAVLGVAQGTIASRVARGRTALRRRLEGFARDRGVRR
jgi:RNA polymerase sigma factor (sigma-70 family)